MITGTIAITWWMWLMIASAIIMFAIVFICKVLKWSGCPIFNALTGFVRRPWFERLLLLVFNFGMFYYGATKETNGTNMAAFPGPMMAVAPILSPVAVDSIGFSMPTNFPPVTNLCFWGIERNIDSVFLGFAWPDSLLFTNNCIDIFGNWEMAGNGWLRLAQVDVSGAMSNVIVQLSSEDLPTNAMERSAFFRIASQQDSDGDGLSDAEEAWTIGTNPYAYDSDGDGMPDGWEVGCGYDPLAFGESLDSDKDGLPDDFEDVLGTDKNNPDTDLDGREDGDEYYFGTDAMNSDTDGDGISDGVEFELGTDPNTSETYEVENDFDANIHTAGAPLCRPVSLMSVESSIFDSPQGNTQAPGPDYEMQGQYDVTITYSGSCTDGFSVLGVRPMGGVTVLDGDSGSSWYDESGPGYKNAFTLMATGASFKPLKTGRFAFQAHADDTVIASIGSKIQFTADFYSANPGAKVNDILIAGQSYPISIEAASVGGPAELSFPAWGEFTPILKPQLAVKFSNPTVIFENGYRNFPGAKMVARRSTKVDINIGARGGGLGGVLQISAQNGSRLELLEGDECRSGNYSIAPDETRYLHGTYVGVAASSDTNDVVIIATFIENETGAVTAYTNSMTIVQVEMTATDRAPREADAHRHIFGVAEYFTIQHYPTNAVIEVNFDSENITEMDNHRFRCHTRMDNSFGSDSCAAIISSSDVSFKTKFRVFDVRVEARNPCVNKYSEDVSPVFLEAGHLLLYLEYWAMPRFVSFANINIREIPDDSQSGAHAGYYDDRSKGGPWSHLSSICSGWHIVPDRDEAFCVDMAGTRRGYEKPWSDGHKEWSIPMGWKLYADSATTQDERLIYPYPSTIQKFKLTKFGVFSIRKFGYEAKRYPYGLITINGKNPHDDL